MTYIAPDFGDVVFHGSHPVNGSTISDCPDPREAMHARFPRAVQPFLTWLTAKPAPGETIPDRSPSHFVALACAQVLIGMSMTWAAIAWAGMAWAGATPRQLAVRGLLALAGLLISSSGLGLFQVVVFHHCSHGTVFKNRETNVTVGRLISAILLFKHFDNYKQEHMLHHSTNKLLTEEDEFAGFVFGMCGLEAAVAKSELWRRVITNLVSPVFHTRFLARRIAAAMGSSDNRHNRIGIGVWGLAIAAALAAGQPVAFLVAVVLPVTVLLQIATVFRILCEHRFPARELIARRGRDFACHATSGVFPGSPPPHGLGRLVLWWAEMLTLHLLVRLFILVGDAPCHDYHHRRPASRRWTSYIHARQKDVDAGSPGFGAAYIDTWGLFRAVDITLASLASTPRGVVPH